MNDSLNLANSETGAAGPCPATPAAPTSPREKRRIKFLAGLREVIDFFEQHPDLDAPYFAPYWNVFLDGDDVREQFQHIAKAIGGTFANSIRKGSTNEYLYLRKSFTEGGCIDFNADREDVCERIVTTKTVPERVIPAQEEQIIPAHEEEVVEWRCPESLLAEVSQ